MNIKFHKYEGTGNDFIMVDDRRGNFPQQNKTLIRKLCDRRFGIGADGLILLQKDRNADFRMVYFNSDGRESTMCGNGGRCITLFAYKLGITGNRILFSAVDGIHKSYLVKSKRNSAWVSLKMSGENKIINTKGGYIIDTGSPHFVKFVGNLESINVNNEGRKIRNGRQFINNGINVNFVMAEGRNIFVRTYERGVEHETLSCGTGVVASSLAASYSGKITHPSQCKVITPGGELKVLFNKTGNNKFTDIWLEGNAKFVFSGIININ